MKKVFREVLGKLQQEEMTYVAQMDYYFKILCVKAEPEALLSSKIADEDGEMQDLEKLAYTLKPDDYTFEIIPMDEKLLKNVVIGIQKEHPEFKMEIVTADENMRLDPEDENEKHVRFIMPEVNKDRYDVLKDGVKAYYESCKERMDATFAKCSAELTARSQGMDEKDIEEAKAELEKTNKQAKEMREKIHDDKQKEIEEAYQKYLTEQNDKAAAEKEKADAEGADVVSRRSDEDEFNFEDMV